MPSIVLPACVLYPDSRFQRHPALHSTAAPWPQLLSPQPFYIPSLPSRPSLNYLILPHHTLRGRCGRPTNLSRFEKLKACVGLRFLAKPPLFLLLLSVLQVLDRDGLDALPDGVVRGGWVNHWVIFGRRSCWQVVRSGRRTEEALTIPALDTELTGIPGNGRSEEGKCGAQVVLVLQEWRSRGGTASLETLQKQWLHWSGHFYSRV